MQLGVHLSWRTERDRQVQYTVESFPVTLLVLFWEGQATSCWISKQRELLGRQSEQSGWSENSGSHLNRNLVLINGVNIPRVSFQHHFVWWRTSIPDFFLKLTFHLKSSWLKTCLWRLVFSSCAKVWQRQATEIKSGFHRNCKTPHLLKWSFNHS